MEILQEQMSRVDDEKIRRMREAQIEAAISDFERHMSKLDEAESKMEILMDTVAYGILYVKGKSDGKRLQENH
jgi:hypothetical protein